MYLPCLSPFFLTSTFCLWLCLYHGLVFALACVSFGLFKDDLSVSTLVYFIFHFSSLQPYFSFLLVLPMEGLNYSMKISTLVILITSDFSCKSDFIITHLFTLDKLFCLCLVVYLILEVFIWALS